MLPLFKLTMSGMAFAVVAVACGVASALVLPHALAAAEENHAFHQAQEATYSACLHDPTCDVERLKAVQEWDNDHRPGANDAPGLALLVFLTTAASLVLAAMAAMRLSPRFNEVMH
jgi:hypothetical protein